MHPVTVGVIGVGRIGRMHTENLVRHLPEAHVKAVASPHIDAGWAGGLEIPIATPDVGVVLGDPDIEAVLITASSDRHVALIRDAAAAGKAIFCEKPIAFAPGLIEEALAAVAAAGVPLQVGFNRRFDPSIRTLAEAIRDGRVGELHSLRVVNRDPRAPDVSFVRRSGGMFFDFTIHDFDTVRFLSGREIVEVFAAGAVLVDPAIGEAGDIDTAMLSLRLDNGALCVIDNSRQAVYGYDQRFEAFGSEGGLAVDNCRPTTLTGSFEHGVIQDRPLPSFVERFREAFIEELRCFLDAVRTGSPVAASGRDALAAVEAAVAATRSMAENRPVRLRDNRPGREGGSP